MVVLGSNCRSNPLAVVSDSFHFAVLEGCINDEANISKQYLQNDDNMIILITTIAEKVHVVSKSMSICKGLPLNLQVRVHFHSLRC